MFQGFFEGKRVLITGHTGFKGSWLSEWLLGMKAEIAAVSLAPSTKPAHCVELEIEGRVDEHILDICESTKLSTIVGNFQPQIIFHMAAQPIVSESYADPIGTWKTNVLGSMSIMEAARGLDGCSLVMITSDKCYENVEWCWGYKETDPLGGADPYSASKAAAELAISSYRRSFFDSDSSKVKVASVRAGNVIGGGDWSRNRVVPDSVKAWADDQSVTLRNPYSTRPWQHVLEPLSGYLAVARALAVGEIKSGEAFNFGPGAGTNQSVEQLVQAMAVSWPGARWKIDTGRGASTFHEAGLLKLNCDKARYQLNWEPTLSFDETAKITTDWYREFYQNDSVNVGSLTKNQINKYCELAGARGASWAES